MIIYGLLEPRTSVLRYIGKAKCPNKRLRAHIAEAKRGSAFKDDWIRSLLRSGSEPALMALEHSNKSEIDDAERFWIASLRAAGAKLMNVADGGDGGALPPKSRAKQAETLRRRYEDPEFRSMMTEVVRRPEVRAKIAAAIRGRTHSAETRAKISAAGKGRKQSPETRAKIATKLRGLTKSPETIAKLRGWKRSPETIAKMIASRPKIYRNRGRPLTPKHRQAISEGHLRRQPNKSGISDG